MARGNQRLKAREKTLQKQGDVRKKNTLSGTQFQRTKWEQAEIMRKKQEEAAQRKAGKAGEQAK